MKKILAVDLDGTLLTIDKTIRKEDLLALQRWKASGNLLAINTGRPLSYYKQIKKLGVDYDIYIGGVGTVCLYQNGERETLFAFSQKTGEKIIDLLMKMELDFVMVFDDDYSYCYNQNNRVNWGAIHKDVRNCYKDGKKDGNKFYVFCGEEEKAIRLTELINSEYSNVAKALQTETDQIEIVPKGADKWQGLLKGLSNAQIAYDGIYCIGDSNNDYDMIANCTESFVMKNGVKKLLEKADHIVGSVEEAVDILLERQVD